MNIYSRHAAGVWLQQIHMQICNACWRYVLHRVNDRARKLANNRPARQVK